MDPIQKILKNWRKRIICAAIPLRKFATAILNMGLPFMPQIAENRLSNAAWA